MAGRGVLTAELAAHRDACPECAARLARGMHFARLLATPPALPAALRSNELRERICERIIESVEGSAHGSAMADAVGAVPAPSEWPEPVVESGLGERLVTAPEGPDQGTWLRMERAILADLATGAVVAGAVVAGTGDEIRRRRIGGWLAGGLGAAAAAAMVLLLVSREQPRQQAAPVVVDLDSPPGVEFTVLRYGALR